MSARIAVIAAALDVRSRALSAYWESLSAAERARAARFVHENDRARFVAARGILREILGAALGIAPGALALSAGPFGKPFLLRDGLAAPLRFSLSHSGGLLVVALACREVGVDVELARPIPRHRLDSLIALALAPREQAALRSLALGSREAAFYRAWVRREALAKAQGSGFAPAPVAGDWAACDLDLGPGVFAALAAEGAAPEIAFMRLPLAEPARGRPGPKGPLSAPSGHGPRLPQPL